MANFPTLSIYPAYPLSKTYEDKVIRSPFEAGYEQTRSRYTRTRRKFVMRYDLLTTADVALLDTFYYTTLNGGADSFVWTNPETAGTHTVRFDSPLSYNTDMYSGSTYLHSCEINVTEV